MGIFFQHSINEHTKLGIWKIEEPESFFLSRVPLKQQVTHPYKRLQHLAGRFLLPALYPDFPLEETVIADTRKPFLHDEKYHFSISHCGNFAAAVASPVNRVGVDIELVSLRLQMISPKFLSDDEAAYLKEWVHLDKLYLQLTTIVWSAKEAVFKWYGAGGIDFRNHMILNGTIIFHPDQWIEIPFLFRKHEDVPLTVMARTFDFLVLAYVVS